MLRRTHLNPNAGQQDIKNPVATMRGKSHHEAKPNEMPSNQHSKHPRTRHQTKQSLAPPNPPPSTLSPSKTPALHTQKPRPSGHARTVRTFSELAVNVFRSMHGVPERVHSGGTEYCARADRRRQHDGIMSGHH